MYETELKVKMDLSNSSRRLPVVPVGKGDIIKEGGGLAEGGEGKRVVGANVI